MNKYKLPNGKIITSKNIANGEFNRKESFELFFLISPEMAVDIILKLNEVEKNVFM